MEAIAEYGSQAISGPPSISLRRIVLSSIIGTAVEWYDFFIYATATALVFNKLFFPVSVASLSSIAAFATYAVGFFARPSAPPSSATTAIGSAAKPCWPPPLSSWAWARS